MCVPEREAGSAGRVANVPLRDVREDGEAAAGTGEVSHPECSVTPSYEGSAVR